MRLGGLDGAACEVDLGSRGTWGPRSVYVGKVVGCRTRAFSRPLALVSAGNKTGLLRPLVVTSKTTALLTVGWT